MWFAETTTTYYDITTTTDLNGASSGFLLFTGVYALFWLAIAVVAIVAMWKLFVKAGQPGWAAIIPIYNIYIMLKIVGRPGWWLLLCFIPIANLIVSIIIALDLGKAFGKDPVYSIVLLWFLSIIGYLILGFGKDKYLGAPNKPSKPEVAAQA